VQDIVIPRLRSALRTLSLASRRGGGRRPSHTAARRFTRVVHRAELIAVVLAAVVLAVVFLPGRSSSGSAASLPSIEQPDLNVAVVPTVDSAGFFIALKQGLFAKKGLHVTFIPAVSSDTVIDAQALMEPRNRVDISCGNYVSYIEAQQAWNSGQRPSPAEPGVVAADLDIFAEGSVMEPGSQGIYTMPGSSIRSLAGLKGRTVAINAPDNVLQLLASSVLAEHGISPKTVHFVTKYNFPQMPAALQSGAVNAAVLPEPFASEAEQSLGVTLLADLGQGATSSFPVVGCAVTQQWAAAHPNTLAAFRSAFEEGQQLADTNRLDVERSMQELPAPFGVSQDTAAIMTLNGYPVGPVDSTRLQRVADVMHQFLNFPSFNVATMLNGG
jgi:NitT/TauT family transport system substrate-binding protein